ncbi:MAG TPA: hypothetical protein PKX05_00940, partial [bacterium]|nr:hypothetical protein [bacterium]
MRKYKIFICLMFISGIPVFSSSPQYVKTSNITDRGFTISWITTNPESGYIKYGISSSAIENIAYDIKGSSFSGTTHYVEVTSLSPSTKYWFDIVSGETIYNNSGSHYSITLAPIPETPPPPPLTRYGKLLLHDGITYAENAIVYVIVKDNDGSGSAGQSQMLSCIVDENGYWVVDIGAIRKEEEDFSDYFSVSSADIIQIFAEGAENGTSFLDTSIGSLSSSAQIEDIILQPDHTLTVNINGPGTVKKNPDFVTYRHADRTMVSLEAIPSGGCRFISWSVDDINSTENPVCVLMDSDKTITANFDTGYVLTTGVISGSGSIQKQPDQPTYSLDSQITLTAIPDPHYHFVSWYGDISGSENPKTVIMNSNKNVYAVFEVNTYNTYHLVVVNQPSNSAIIHPSSECYNAGTEITLTCVPFPHYHFVCWADDAIGTETSITIVMDADKNISAICEIDKHAISLAVVGSGNVHISPETGGSYPYDSTITLNAVPEPGYIFSSWSGDISGEENPKTFRITQDISIIAVFTKKKGDINLDGNIDISDVILCLRMAIGLEPADIQKADINNDG